MTCRGSHQPLTYHSVLGWRCETCHADGFTTDVDRMHMHLRAAGIKATRKQARMVALALTEVRAEERLSAQMHGTREGFVARAVKRLDEARKGRSWCAVTREP